MIRKLLIAACDTVFGGDYADFLRRLAGRRAERLGDKAGIGFLLDLDNRLYALQGEAAVRYGDGRHPKHRLTGYHDFFVAQIGKGERVLDVGCGKGELAHDIAAKAGAIVVALDKSERCIEVAKTRYAHPNITYVCGDARERIPSGGFDTVVMSNVLEHLDRREDFLRCAIAGARPGRFLLRVPLFERDWRVPLKKELGLPWQLDPTHETEYTVASFAVELARAGLRPMRTEIRWGEIWAEATPVET